MLTHECKQNVKDFLHKVAVVYSHFYCVAIMLTYTHSRFCVSYKPYILDLELYSFNYMPSLFLLY